MELPQGIVSGGGQFLSWATGMLLVWALGLVFGWMLPRPKWLQRSLRSKALFLATPPGLWVRRVTLTIHATLIVRQVWRYFHTPGTFRSLLKAVWVSVTTLQPLEWPKHHDGRVVQVIQEVSVAPGDEQQQQVAAPIDELPNWYVTHEDLQFFRHKVELETEQEAKAWSHMMDMSYDGTTYAAWRRGTPNGKNEYKSITITPNATAEEFMDFYLDDPTRPKWDGMISEHSIVEAGPAEHRALVVRWKRVFPFSFISSRDYVIARRLFRVGDTLYGITKGVAHPAAPEDGKTVRVDAMYSMWRCRTIPCPHGSERPACETVLLHHEDVKIPERLSKFAVRHGMPGFFKSMVPQVKEFVAKRRIRLEPTAVDPQGYGISALAPAALPRSSFSTASDFGSEASFGTDSAFESEGQLPLQRAASTSSLQRSPSIRRLGMMMLASGVALAIARTGSGSNLGGPAEEEKAIAAKAGLRSRSGKHGSSGSKKHHQQQHHQKAHHHRRQRHSEVAALAVVPE